MRGQTLVLHGREGGRMGETARRTGGRKGDAAEME